MSEVGTEAGRQWLRDAICQDVCSCCVADTIHKNYETLFSVSLRLISHISRSLIFQIINLIFDA